MGTLSKIQINKQPFWVNDSETEFPRLKTDTDKATLVILKDLAEYQWICDFITYWFVAPLPFSTVEFGDLTHGGYLLTQTLKQTLQNETVTIACNATIDAATAANLKYGKYKDVSTASNSAHNSPILLVSEKDDAAAIFAETKINTRLPLNTFILSRCDLSNANANAEEFVSWRLKGPYKCDWWLSHYKNSVFPEQIAANSASRIDETQKEITFGNLLGLCMMVKNAGEQFEDTLRHNLPLVDYWMIYDTGSTDNTKDVIRRVTAELGIPGQLYEDSIALEDLHFDKVRNQCFEMAGKRCLYMLTLDDTYRITPSIRPYMADIAGDQIADTISCYVNSRDVYYASNRIIKTSLDYQFRYMYRIHEVISTAHNLNIIIPFDHVYITDVSFKYMDERTLSRKQYEIQWLNDEFAAAPNDPRPLYYIGQVYRLLGEYEKAFEYLVRRANIANEGFIQERYDAAFEAARISNYELKYPWEYTLQLYNLAIKICPQRPEPYYFIGIHYIATATEYNTQKAFGFFKQAYLCGMALDAQFNIKPTLTNYYIPLNLARLAYTYNDYALGFQAALLLLTHWNTTIKLSPELNDPNVYNECVSWHNIYRHIVEGNDGGAVNVVAPSQKPIAVFVADGGYNQWSGTSILTNGVGGSETFIIEMARNIQASGAFQVYVFCNCPTDIEIFEGVTYQPLSKFCKFTQTHRIHSCIISRFIEYLPTAYIGNVDNVYCILHDVSPVGNIFLGNPKLKAIYCLTEWHCQLFSTQWSMFAHLVRPFYYGVDKRFMLAPDAANTKKKWSFIYSSFPNRGLLQLLQMWPAIRTIQPKATLNIYCDLNHKWTNEYAPEQMRAIRTLLANFDAGITVHGWVDKAELAAAWKRAHIWLYPCTFAETFCLTALEAAASGTFVVTNDLAALQYTVGDRGLVIKGDAATTEWQQATIEAITPFLGGDNSNVTDYIKRNSAWASTLSWSARAKDMCAQWLSVYNYKQSYQCMRSSSSSEIWNKINECISTTVTIDTNTAMLEVNTLTGMGAIHLLCQPPFRNKINKVFLLENIPLTHPDGITDINYNIAKYKESFAATPEITVYSDEIMPSLVQLYTAEYLNKMGVISYYCNSSPDIVGHLHLLYSLLKPTGILILNIFNRNEQLPLINYFFNSHAKTIKSLYETNLDNDEMIIILQK